MEDTLPESLTAERPGYARPRLMVFPWERGRHIRVTRVAATDHDDLIIRTPFVNELEAGTPPDLWRAVYLLPTHVPTMDAPAPGPSWLMVRGTWRIGAVTLQLKGTVVKLVRDHALQLVGTF